MRKREPSEKRTPGFFWQGCFILLPVAVLSIIGLLAVMQDRQAVENQARQRAQEIADETAEELWAALTSASQTGAGGQQPLSFSVDASGALVDPPPLPGLPIPLPLDIASLPPELARLWTDARRVSVGAQSASAAQAAGLWRGFLASNPPPSFLAPAQYSLALCLAGQRKVREALEVLAPLSQGSLTGTGESGLPLQPLACLKSLELTLALTNPPAPAALLTQAADALGSNLLRTPSFLGPWLLDQAEQALAKTELADKSRTWRRMIERQAAARALHESARSIFQANRANDPISRLVPVEPGTNRPPEPPLLATPPAPPAPRVSVPRLFWIEFQSVDPATLPGGLEDARSVFAHRLSRVVSNAQNGDMPTEDALLAFTAPDDRKRLNSSNLPKDSLPGDAGLSAWTRRWLAVRHDASEGASRIVCWPAFDESAGGVSVAHDLVLPLRASLQKATARLPEYMGLSLELAGRVSIASNALPTVTRLYGGPKGGGRAAARRPQSALASAVRHEAGAELLRVTVHLTGPDLLFEVQRARSMSFGLLVLCSAAVALLGFVSARRAYLRQQRLTEMKSDFVSSVSHELRAPIASVRLLTESLERGKVQDPARQREYFRFILQECRRLSSLIENVLDFSRIEEGRKRYEFEPANARDLVETTVKLMEPNAAEKHVALRLETPDGAEADCTALLDARAIQQAVVNLIDNAVKHSAAGGTVTVSLNCEPGPNTESAPRKDAPGPAPGARLRISVADHGPGIPPEEHQRIFERFYRRGSELRRETQGVGIGLSIVKHIVAAHGGRVVLESAVGQGACFTLELPTEGNAHGTPADH